MAITELITIELLPSSGYSIYSPELSRLITTLSMRQCTFSAYPVTLYADISSSRTFYLLTGWRNSAALTQWRNNDNGIFQELERYIKIKRTLYLAMDFDTIPRGKSRMLCMLRNSIKDEEEDPHEFQDGIGSEPDRWDSHRTGILAAQSRSPPGYCSDAEDVDEEICRIEWTGGGHELQEDERQVFHRFIMYGKETSEHAVRECLRSRDFTAMKQISIPRPPPNIPGGP
ncbi:hypothetical protein PM082_023679 [Marasmius tenuissimus]|nr:hypothetical protein PM082_023679 [Marasmius tenuissimus]